MEIYDGAGKASTKTGLLQVTKGFEALLFTIPAVEFDDLSNEKIRIVRQRSGKNDEVTNGFVNFKDWVLIANYGAAAICHDTNGDLSITVDLTSGGNVHLLEKDEIRIEMEGLKTAHAWKINTMETFLDTDSLYQTEFKTLGSEQKTGVFTCEEADILLIEDKAEITDIRLTWGNGDQTTHTMRELRAISRQIDPVAHITADGEVKSGFAGKLQVPVAGCVLFEINKEQGSIINVYLRREV